MRVIAAVILHQKRILVAQRAKGTLAGLWEFPGGKQEPGEIDQETLNRELREELNLSVQIVAKLGEFPHQYPGGSLNLVVFVVNSPSDRHQVLEHQATRWVTMDELKEMSLTPADRDVLPHLNKWLQDQQIL